ncbi:MAG TPA: hypothetical protein VHD56_15585 [Tepidisphaeraceae bacterium]|nr:hypothetical protein [Tepidisphaeraceae bacterium]
MILESPKPGGVPATDQWPPEVNMILSAMEITPHPNADQRKGVRLSYRVRAQLRLFVDGTDVSPWTLYTRDVDTRGVGFITPHRLPLGYGGVVELLSPKGKKVTIDCTVYRCRQAVPGWYEGALYFNREQWMFTAEER